MERFLDYFTPSSYSLELYVFRNKESLRGTVKISGRFPEHSSLETVKLHAVDMIIKTVKIQKDAEYVDCEYKYDGKAIEIAVPATIVSEIHQDVADADDDYYYDDPYSATFSIEFETKLNHNMQGCYLSTYEFNGQERQIVATQFESHYAREAFPCIDEPAAKSTFSLTLLVPDRQPDDVILANTPLRYQDINRFCFETTPRMSTYLLAWVIGPFQSVSTVNKDGVKVTSYCALNQSLESLLFANTTAARALEYYNTQFQEPYPLPKLDQVALPDFEAGAMENWGLVTYRESMLLAEPNASIDTKKSVAVTVTHELSHQWFGNLVTMKWWDDLWLNESFATIMEYYAADALYPDLNVWEDFFTGDCLAALKRDCLPDVQSVKQAVHHPSEIATLFDGAIVYAKGARLILMLVRAIGETDFLKGVSYYLAKFRYDNAEGRDLWDCLQIYTKLDVSGLMSSWIGQPGYPALRSEQADAEAVWKQQRFLIDGSTDHQQWVLPEITDDMSGHYLIELSDAEFATKLADFNQLSQEQKLRLLIDRTFLSKTGVVSSSSLLDLLPRFTQETSGAVWEAIAGVIGDLKLFFPPESKPAEQYKQFLRDLLHDRFVQIEYGLLSDANTLRLRDVLLSIAYYAENQEVLQRLAHLYDNNLTAIDPELRSHILGAKLYFDEDEVFSLWFEAYSTISDPELKQTLLAELASYAKLPAHLDRLMSLLNQTDIVRPQDHIFLFIYLLRNYRTRTRAIKWLTQNWDFVERLTGEKSIEDYPRYTASAIRTPEEAKIFYTFFEAQLANSSLESAAILRRTLMMAHTEIDARFALIARDAASVQRKISQLISGRSSKSSQSKKQR